jgi:Nuclease-related domain
VLRENMRDWVITAALGAGCITAAVILEDRAAALIFAGLAGAIVMLCVFGWVIGDVRSLPWLWGAIGERQTEEALKGLDNSWQCEHDIPRTRGNWDHVLVGPPGVYLLDSKRFSGQTVVARDGLASGRFSYAGSWFRAAAAKLCDALEPRVGRRQWVQPVVVVWGDFPQRRLEREGVVYVHGSELLAWLRSQPGSLSADDCRELFEAVRQIRET